MTSFRELMAVPVPSGSNVATTEPCVEISREGVACPEQPIVSNNAEDGGDSGATASGVLAVSAIAGTVAFALSL